MSASRWVSKTSAPSLDRSPDTAARHLPHTNDGSVEHLDRLYLRTVSVAGPARPIGVALEGSRGLDCCSGKAGGVCQTATDTVRPCLGTFRSALLPGSARRCEPKLRSQSGCSVAVGHGHVRADGSSPIPVRPRRPGSARGRERARSDADARDDQMGRSGDRLPCGLATPHRRSCESGSSCSAAVARMANHGAYRPRLAPVTAHTSSLR